MTKLAFVIGGTGQIGRAIGARLLNEGWNVILASRGERDIPEDLVRLGARTVVLNRNKPGELARFLGSGADAVIDTVAYDQTHADQLLDVEQVVGQFVVISSCSVYRDNVGRTLDEARENGFPDLPDGITEKQPTVEPGLETYSTRKVALERRLLDHAQRPVAVLRPCAIHGTHSSHPREWWFVKRMLDDRKIIPLCFNGRSRFHTTAVANIAEVAAVALNQPQSLILNIADPEAPTVLEIGSLVAKAMGWSGEFLPLDIGDPRFGSPVGWTPWSVPAPFTVNTDAARQIGYKPATDYAKAVPQVCEWLRSQAAEEWRQRFPVLAAYTIPLFDYVAEDAFFDVQRS
ncbi:NAD-dependent epimerase/dehydratase family protein [Ensifer sp. 4252]|uniref:NAD-dependent epimerase/dehydratase family protein n=1 Tax=Ensifer sp. 4252 TaxID=3373915 RepID=UPI003D21F6C2